MDGQEALPHIPFHFGCCCEWRVEGTDAHSARWRKLVQNISAVTCCQYVVMLLAGARKKLSWEALIAMTIASYEV